MLLPRGYDRLFNRHRHFVPSPVPDMVNTVRSPWGATTYAAGQAQVTTVGAAVDNGIVPVAIVGLIGLVAGAYGGWRIARHYGWGG